MLLKSAVRKCALFLKHLWKTEATPRDLSLVFANISFETRDVQMPDIFKVESFRIMGFKILINTNDAIKQFLQEQKKNKR